MARKLTAKIRKSYIYIKPGAPIIPFVNIVILVIEANGFVSILDLGIYTTVSPPEMVDV